MWGRLLPAPALRPVRSQLPSHSPHCDPVTGALAPGPAAGTSPAALGLTPRQPSSSRLLRQHLELSAARAALRSTSPGPRRASGSGQGRAGPASWPPALLTHGGLSGQPRAASRPPRTAPTLARVTTSPGGQHSGLGGVQWLLVQGLAL